MSHHLLPTAQPYITVTPRTSLRGVASSHPAVPLASCITTPPRQPALVSGQRSQ
ncbi:hypothetical protein BB8028_0007g02020 [Beauveria bassiana]|uniref:Uncharacterized protein n=1 Tax=Beauveria bassiana TaxID=176275 RepID=A0A2S7YLW8_BEABA|nr:hypothetical protein BB8028_0007g02020 [Beauveria bassiana]